MFEITTKRRVREITVLLSYWLYGQFYVKSTKSKKEKSILFSWSKNRVSLGNLKRQISKFKVYYKKSAI